MDELQIIDRLIDEAKRDLAAGRYEARETIWRLKILRQEANARAVAALSG